MLQMTLCMRLGQTCACGTRPANKRSIDTLINTCDNRFDDSTLLTEAVACVINLPGHGVQRGHLRRRKLIISRPGSVCAWDPSLHVSATTTRKQQRCLKSGSGYRIKHTHPTRTKYTKMPAEIHDLYDSILILDFGSQVSFGLNNERVKGRMLM